MAQGSDLDLASIPILYAEVDDTGVPMVAGELAGRSGKQADGSAKTREVRLGAIFTQTETDMEHFGRIELPPPKRFCSLAL